MPRLDTRNLKRIGYWAIDQNDKTIPWPGDLIDESWDAFEREKVAQYIDSSRVGIAWRGYSHCRLCELNANGTTCKTDGEYLFPSGLSHYVRVHSVKLPQAFIDKALGK